jgi:hypothetical protein
MQNSQDLPTITPQMQQDTGCRKKKSQSKRFTGHYSPNAAK